MASWILCVCGIVVTSIGLEQGSWPQYVSYNCSILPGANITLVSNSHAYDDCPGSDASLVKGYLKNSDDCFCNAATVNYRLDALVHYTIGGINYTNKLCGTCSQTMCVSGDGTLFTERLIKDGQCGAMYTTSSTYWKEMLDASVNTTCNVWASGEYVNFPYWNDSPRVHDMEQDEGLLIISSLGFAFTSMYFCAQFVATRRARQDEYIPLQ